MREREEKRKEESAAARTTKREEATDGRYRYQLGRTHQASDNVTLGACERVSVRLFVRCHLALNVHYHHALCHLHHLRKRSKERFVFQEEFSPSLSPSHTPQTISSHCPSKHHSIINRSCSQYSSTVLVGTVHPFVWGCSESGRRYAERKTAKRKEEERKERSSPLFLPFFIPCWVLHEDAFFGSRRRSRRSLRSTIL